VTGGTVMALLIVGLILFLGVHSVRIFADSWRADFIARHGLNTWKVLYSVASLVGFVLLVWVSGSPGRIRSRSGIRRNGSGISRSPST
jgi:uncharacterized membrane protein